MGNVVRDSAYVCMCEGERDEIEEQKGMEGVQEERSMGGRDSRDTL